MRDLGFGDADRGVAVGVAVVAVDGVVTADAVGVDEEEYYFRTGDVDRIGIVVGVGGGDVGSWVDCCRGGRVFRWGTRRDFGRRDSLGLRCCD